MPGALTDWEEGQRVPDEANGYVPLSKEQKNYPAPHRSSVRKAHRPTCQVVVEQRKPPPFLKTRDINMPSFPSKEVYNRHTTEKQPAETAEASQVVQQSGTDTTSSMNAPTLPADKDNAEISEKQEGAEKYLSLSADNRDNGISERISPDFNGTEVEENGRLGEAADRYRSGGTPSREDARGAGSPLSREEEERIGERYAKVGILRWIVDAGCAIAITKSEGPFLRHNGPIPLTASPPP